MIGCVDSAGYTSYTELTEPRHKQALILNKWTRATAEKSTLSRIYAKPLVTQSYPYINNAYI